MTKLDGHAVLKAQKGGKGFYAEVSVEIQLTEGVGEISIESTPVNAEEWRPAAIIGIRHAWKHLPSRIRRGKNATVRVTQICWQPADTSDIVVVHVAMQSLFDAFDITVDSSNAFIEPFGLFVFPK